ncbi:Rha family transcriptional regulator [Desulfobacula sp.]|uniref:Rha family transcriptional regulator n=1 Tax=Desulfobacula sp. TaxID=2593537 RepID=UPI0026276D71|nr:Rha family transcriptional regulator [Desulfobacula sp.]
MDEDGRLTTTSLKVAEVYGKRHDDVLKKIKNLNCNAKFHLPNFRGVEYIDKKWELRPSYEITKDGFTFLVSRFSGKKAGLFMEQFIAVFNAMEKALMQAPAVRNLEPLILTALTT